MTLLFLKPFLTKEGVALFFHGIRDAFISHIVDATHLRRSLGASGVAVGETETFCSGKKQLVEK